MSNNNSACVLLKGFTKHHFTNQKVSQCALRLCPRVFVCVTFAAIRELAQQPARQLFRQRRRLRGDDRSRGRQVERRAMQLQPALHLQEGNRWGQPAQLAHLHR